MAHLIDTMAYTGQTPWHGLGNLLPAQQSLDIWLQAAGMDWTIEQSDVMFNVASDALHIRPYSDSKVLYRFTQRRSQAVGAGPYRPGHETQGRGCGEVLPAARHQLRWHPLHHGAVHFPASGLQQHLTDGAA